MSGDRYVVAVKRESRAEAPADWLEQMQHIEGIRLIGATGIRAQIEAEPEPVKELRARLGRFLTIEPAIMHRALSAR